MESIREETMKCRVLSFCLVLSAAAFMNDPARAESCSVLASDRQLLGDSIGVVFDDTVNPEVIAEALSLWQQCADHGTGFPALKIGSRGARRILRVTHEHVHVQTSRRKKCGSFTGQEIRIYSFVKGRNGRTYSCGSLAQNLAHELGHALGLRDAPLAEACSSDIMTALHPGNLHARGVDAAACRAVARRWLTPAELRFSPPPRLAQQELRPAATDTPTVTRIDL